MLADHRAKRASAVYGRGHPDSLMLRTAFRLALRQTEGLITSMLSLMGLTLSAPDHTTVSSRAVAVERAAQRRH